MRVLRPVQPRMRWSAWIFGALALLAVVALALHLGEVDRFFAIVRHLAPGWLLLAVAAQLATYGCVAWSWRLALRAEGHRLSSPVLLSLAVQKLFVDQTLPSGGLSGDTWLVGALRARTVSRGDALGVLLALLVAHYAGYLLDAALACAVLVARDELRGWMLAIAVVFALVCIAIPLAITLGRRHAGRLPALARRAPRLGAWLHDFAHASTRPLRRRGLLLRLVALDAAVSVFDALTLWVLLHALGQRAAFAVVFPSFMLALMAAMLGPLPLGLGAFEGACVAMLVAQGVPIETALVATLLLRGLTTWLPMLPGLLLVRREMGGSQVHASGAPQGNSTAAPSRRP